MRQAIREASRFGSGPWQILVRITQHERRPEVTLGCGRLRVASRFEPVRDGYSFDERAAVELERLNIERRELGRRDHAQHRSVQEILVLDAFERGD